MLHVEWYRASRSVVTTNKDISKIQLDHDLTELKRSNIERVSGRIHLKSLYRNARKIKKIVPGWFRFR